MWKKLSICFVAVLFLGTAVTGASIIQKENSIMPCPATSTRSPGLKSFYLENASFKTFPANKRYNYEEVELGETVTYIFELDFETSDGSKATNIDVYFIEYFEGEKVESGSVLYKSLKREDGEIFRLPITYENKGNYSLKLKLDVDGENKWGINNDYTQFSVTLTTHVGVKHQSIVKSKYIAQEFFKLIPAFYQFLQRVL